MPTKIKHYQLYCTSEGAWKSWHLPDADPVPTTCPTNTMHNVSAGSLKIAAELVQENAKSADNILYTKPHPASLAFEMCDRDMLILTGIVDARASVLINGANVNGDIVYSASTPGACGNSITVEHAVGDSGVGHENRALDAAFVYDGKVNLVVTYATDGNGNPIVPTAGQVVAMLGAKTDVLMAVFPSLVGDGTGLVQTTATTSLTGGSSPSLSDVKINPLTFSKGEWNELQQVGCYKLDNGSYVPVDDQLDADSNACLSVWRYWAHDQATMAPQKIEIRDGLLLVDSTINDSSEHQAFAIGAPQVPAVYGGQVVQFDAYLKYYKGQVLGATSPQAKELDPAGPGGTPASELRIYVYYPAGAKHTHVLRLVTYRPPGTF